MNYINILISLITIYLILYLFVYYLSIGLKNINNENSCDPINCSFLPPSWLTDQYKFTRFDYYKYTALYS